MRWLGVINLTWENLQIVKHKSVRNESFPDMCFCDLKIFSGKVYHPEPPHAQSIFLFPIVFGNNIFNIDDFCEYSFYTIDDWLTSGVTMLVKLLLGNHLRTKHARTHADAHAHTRTRARAHTHTHTHARTHARMYAHTHKHTHARAQKPGALQY